MEIVTEDLADTMRVINDPSIGNLEKVLRERKSRKPAKSPATLRTTTPARRPEGNRMSGNTIPQAQQDAAFLKLTEHLARTEPWESLLKQVSQRNADPATIAAHTFRLEMRNKSKLDLLNILQTETIRARRAAAQYELEHPSASAAPAGASTPFGNGVGERVKVYDPAKATVKQFNAPSAPR